MRPFPLVRVIVVALLLACVPQMASAQNGPNAENGFTFYGSYDGTTMDTVNLMNGNLTVHIPLPFYFAQRGGKLDPRYYLVANSKNWSVETENVNNEQETFWTYVGATGHLTSASLYNGAYIATPITNLTLLRTYILTTIDGENTTAVGLLSALMTWDGASHSLSVYNSTQDTTGYQITQSNPDSYGVPQTATITDRNGNVYQGNFANSGGCTIVRTGGVGGTITTTCQQAAMPAVVDSNGNEYGLTDTLGRTVPTPTSTTNTTGCVSTLPISGVTTYSYTGPSTAYSGTLVSEIGNAVRGNTLGSPRVLVSLHFFVFSGCCRCRILHIAERRTEAVMNKSDDNC